VLRRGPKGAMKAYSEDAEDLEDSEDSEDSEGRGWVRGNRKVSVRLKDPRDFVVGH